MTTSAWQGAGLVVAVFMAFMIAVHHYRRRGVIESELSRKSIHIGMGLVTLSFPWLFSSVRPVIVLAFFFTIGLFASRFVPRLRSVLGDVLNLPGRKSLGEIVFPAAVGLLFVLAHEQPLLFCIPVLILTLADSAAALIGSRYGEVRYLFWENEKSLEGSAVFFVVAFLCTYVPLLLLTETGRPDSLLIALTVALLVMLLEALAWRGLDNLFIPLGAFFFLNSFLSLSFNALVVRLGMAVSLTVCLATYCFIYGVPDRVSPKRVASSSGSVRRKRGLRPIT